VNELLASHEPAKNALINVEAKAEHEITELAKEYEEFGKELIEEDKK